MPTLQSKKFSAHVPRPYQRQDPGNQYSLLPKDDRPFPAGKTRLAKYYIPLEDTGKRQMEYDVHRAIASRDPKHTNFVEVEPLPY